MPTVDYRAQKLKTRNKDRLITQPEKKENKTNATQKCIMGNGK